MKRRRRNITTCLSLLFRFLNCTAVPEDMSSRLDSKALGSRFGKMANNYNNLVKAGFHPGGWGVRVFLTPRLTIFANTKGNLPSGYY